MTGKFLSLLAQVPVELIDAENVKSVVINGETIEKEFLIRTAKNEARFFMEKNNQVFSPYNSEQLTNILNFY